MNTEELILLELNNVSRSFNRRKVIDSVSFKLHKGNYFAIKGSNGAGKSTLLRLILGDFEFEKGNIDYYDNGNKVSLLEFLSKTSFSAPYFNLYEEFTLIELSEIYCEFRKIELNQKLFNDLSKSFALNDHLNKQIKNFSSGMKQRAKLILCFLSEPEIIFLDEPSTNLDVDGMNVLFEILKEYKQKGATLLLASNEIRELELCDSFLSLS